MRNDDKTREQLIGELAQMRERIAKLEATEAEHEQVEKALRESEERYRSLFERVPVGLYRTTVEGQILDANPALVQMLRYPDRATLLKSSIIDRYVNHEDRRRWLDLMERHQQVIGFETYWHCYNGQPIWVSDSARVIHDEQGNILYYEGSVEDITARKKVEQERETLIGQLQEPVTLDTHNVQNDQIIVLCAQPLPCLIRR